MVAAWVNALFYWVIEWKIDTIACEMVKKGCEMSWNASEMTKISMRLLRLTLSCLRFPLR